jgi:hypothetical protein
MLKLFAVLLGGRADGCNTELHDVVFIVGESLESSYPILVNKWFGIHKRLHIDSSVELNYIDGYEVLISVIKPAKNNDNKIFFVNFGAYKQGFFGEIHNSAFYVATSKTEALERAKKELCISLNEPHCDDNLSVDDIIAIESIDKHYIYLKKSANLSKLHIESYYRRLDVPDIIKDANELII